MAVPYKLLQPHIHMYTAGFFRKCFSIKCLKCKDFKIRSRIFIQQASPGSFLLSKLNSVLLKAILNLSNLLIIAVPSNKYIHEFRSCQHQLLMRRAFHRNRKDVDLIPTGGPNSCGFFLSPRPRSVYTLHSTRLYIHYNTLDDHPPTRLP